MSHPADEQIPTFGRRAASKARSLVMDHRELGRLKRRVAELEKEIQETRRLNRRVAELTDIVQELLLPVALQDQAKLRELLQQYSKSL